MSRWRWRDIPVLVNTGWHRRALITFMVVVLAHWVDYFAQAVQVYRLGWPATYAGGVLGLVFPWEVRAEWLRYGFAVVILVGIFVLRPGFAGRAHMWWTIALGFQAWRQYEHLLMVIQAHTGSYVMGRTAPTSILQLVVPRLELHLFYNVAVFVPMAVAVVMHCWPRGRERADMWCTCAVWSRAAGRSSGLGPAVDSGVVGEDGQVHRRVDMHADRRDLAGERCGGEVAPGQQRPVRQVGR
jgi:hypothetical protein